MSVSDEVMVPHGAALETILARMEGATDRKRQIGLDRAFHVTLAASLEAMFGDIDNIDAWIGLMSEDHVPGAAIGETLMAIFTDQFSRLRDGDRFFYLNDADLLPYLSEIENTSLADIIAFNSGAELSGNVFVVPAPASVALIGLAGLGATRRRRA